MLLAVIGIVLTGARLLANEVETASAKPVDPAIVHEKIAGLGLRDDTIDSNEQPERWLKHHRGQVLGELIKGLDSIEDRIAAGCLKVLDGSTDSDEFIEDGWRITPREDHPPTTGS